MTEWTPEAVRRVLDGPNRAHLDELANYLIGAATVGRAVVLRRHPWLSAGSAGKADDVNAVMLALFDQKQRLLRKFGEYSGFQPLEHALRKYVIGITYFVLRRRGQKYRSSEQLLIDDLAGPNDFALFERVYDLERAVQALSPEDRHLSTLIYSDRLPVAEICATLGVTLETFEKRKSRLIMRLRVLIANG
jgi:hypothetical protein